MENEDNATLPQEHALLNTVVLKQVFKYLKPSGNLDTLKSVRQVCKVWRDESLGLWRETAVVKLTPEIIDDPELATVTQLLEEKPFQKYKLRRATVDVVKCFEENEQANRFWSIVGPHVKHLTLEWVTFDCVSYKLDQKPPRTLMQFLIGLLPNLSTLVVDHVTVNTVAILPFTRRQSEYVVIEDLHTEELQHPNVVSFQSCSNVLDYFVFTNFPNLQRLVLDSSKTLLKLFRDMNGSTLKHLHLNLPFAENLWNINGLFGKLRFAKISSLERLSVSFKHDSSFNHRFLPAFVKVHCKQLKTLEVSSLSYVSPYYTFLSGCPLNQLTELRLWGNVVKDLSFLKWTPKLKVLHMDPYGLEKQELITPPNPYPVDLLMVYFTKLKGSMAGLVLNDLEYLQFSCEGGFLTTLREWMPNLKTLRTILHHGSIAILCEQWPLLEHLVCMYGSTIDDEDITGTRDGLGILGKKGLVDLPELKTFHLNTGCDEGRLTDMAAHAGFLKMSKLTDLQVCVSEQFSVRAEEVLKERLRNAVIIRNYYGNQEHDNWQCCKNKQFMQTVHGRELEGLEATVSLSYSVTTLFHNNI